MNPYDRFSREELIEMLAEYDRSITWDTTCLNCGHLYDKLYALEADMNRIIEIDEDDDVTQFMKLWKISDITDKYRWGKGG